MSDSSNSRQLCWRLFQDGHAGLENMLWEAVKNSGEEIAPDTLRSSPPGLTDSAISSNILEPISR